MGDSRAAPFKFGLKSTDLSPSMPAKLALSEQLLCSNAYRLFYSEAHSFCAELATALGQSEQLPESTISKLRLAGHTLKGGAGFFGLSQLASTGDEIEKVAIDSGTNGNLERLLERLRSETEALPEPKAREKDH